VTLAEPEEYFRGLIIVDVIGQMSVITSDR
jgi:hypothetical protein